MNAAVRNIGYFFTFTWSFLLFNGTILFPTIETATSLSTIHIMSSVGTVLVGVAVALLAGRLTPLASRRELVWAAGIVGAAGTCCLSLSGTSFLSHHWIAAGYFMAGAAMTILVCGWRERLLLQGLKAASLSLVASVLTSSALYIAISFLPYAIVVPCAAALPVLAAFSMTMNLPASHPDPGAGQPDETNAKPAAAGSSLKIMLGNAPVRLFLAVLFVCIAYGIVRTQSISASMFAFTDGNPFLTACSEIIATGLAAAVALYAQRVNTAVVFYVALPVAAVSALLPTDTPTMQVLAVALINISTALIDMLAFFLLVKNVRTNAASVLFGLGILQACRMLGNTLGQTLASLVPDPTLSLAVTFLSLLVAALVILGNSVQFSLVTAKDGPQDPNGEARPDPDCPSQAALGAKTDIRLVRAALLANTCGLSEREAQVLALWGTGHTGPYIEERLHISKNTVKTHLSHIYAKTGVTGKEELLQLLERTESEAT